MKILMSLIFYPRGGSAQVARYLSRALLELGHEVRLVTGTLRDGNPQHDAEVFFGELPLTLVDYTDAWRGFERGEDPLSDEWSVPFHPSYEDKSGVPDRVFFKLTETEYAALVLCWTRVFEGVRERFQPDLLHLHHLTHANVAAADLFSEVHRGLQIFSQSHIRFDGCVADRCRCLGKYPVVDWSGCRGCVSPVVGRHLTRGRLFGAKVRFRLHSV